jgi:hypothetical protein
MATYSSDFNKYLFFFVSWQLFLCKNNYIRQLNLLKQEQPFAKIFLPFWYNRVLCFRQVALARSLHRSIRLGQEKTRLPNLYQLVSSDSFKLAVF